MNRLGWIAVFILVDYGDVNLEFTVLNSLYVLVVLFADTLKDFRGFLIGYLFALVGVMAGDCEV